MFLAVAKCCCCCLLFPRLVAAARGRLAGQAGGSCAAHMVAGAERWRLSPTASAILALIGAEWNFDETYARPKGYGSLVNKVLAVQRDVQLLYIIT
jgi:hypothetical protein